ncbi:MAG: ABC transporter ATP-binding protein [Desulfobacterales bacterium]
MMVVLEHTSKTFRTLRGKVDAMIDISLSVESGEFFTLLGPSGCGKSTTLNVIAGLEHPSEGVIRFGETVMADTSRGIMVPPRNRNVAMVFQSYALYPHMNVFENIAFPLKIRRRDKNKIQDSVEKTAAVLGIENLLDRRPAELSGGQRQRVSIARALVRDPNVFLLDEPLSNLDAQLRTNTRAELKRLQREMGITTFYVTHDQTEAMTLGDRIALFKNGRLMQCGTPKQMYEHPENAFAASFIGSPPMNLIPVEVHHRNTDPVVVFESVDIPIPQEKRSLLDRIAGKKVWMGIRPEHIRINKEKAPLFTGRIQTIEPLGREIIIHIETGKNRLVALSETERYSEGDAIGVSFPAECIHLFDRRDEKHAPSQ